MPCFQAFPLCKKNSGFYRTIVPFRMENFRLSCPIESWTGINKLLKTDIVVAFRHVVQLRTLSLWLQRMVQSQRLRTKCALATFSYPFPRCFFFARHIFTDSEVFNARFQSCCISASAIVPLVYKGIPLILIAASMRTSVSITPTDCYCIRTKQIDL